MHAQCTQDHHNDHDSLVAPKLEARLDFDIHSQLLFDLWELLRRLKVPVVVAVPGL